jgi:dihydrofolate reductase
VDICLIWAQASNGAIGKRGALPWMNAEDLERFQMLTDGHPVLMGRKTWEAIPEGMLDGRQAFVLTRQHRSIRGAVACTSLHEAFTLASVLRSPKLFLLGGATVYTQGLRIADRLYVAQFETEIDDAEAFAPAIDRSLFELVGQTRVATTGLARVLQEYRRKRLH